jgi:hypothetical protein
MTAAERFSKHCCNCPTVETRPASGPHSSTQILACPTGSTWPGVCSGAGCIHRRRRVRSPAPISTRAAPCSTSMSSGERVGWKRTSSSISSRGGRGGAYRSAVRPFRASHGGTDVEVLVLRVAPLALPRSRAALHAVSQRGHAAATALRAMGMEGVGVCEARRHRAGSRRLRCAALRAGIGDVPRAGGGTTEPARSMK